MNVTEVLGTDPAIDVGDRNIEVTWVLNVISEKVTEVVVLSVGHDKDRKRFFATLGQEKRGVRSRSFAIFGGMTVATAPVARFSMKALTEFSRVALDRLAHLAGEGNEKVVALLTPSDRSCGCDDMYHEAGCEVYAAEARALSAGRR